MQNRDEDQGRLDELIRYGKVDTVDLAAGTLVASTGDIVTQPIRWLELRAGATRTWSPPNEGEQLVILCPSGDIEGAIALRGVTSDAHPHVGNSKRELVEFTDGTVIAYDPEAHAFELLAGTGTIRLVAETVTIDADVTITRDLQVDGKVHADGLIESDDDVKASSISLKQHKHGGVQAGAAQTGVPL